MRRRADALLVPHSSRLAPDHPRRAEILAAHAAAVEAGEPLYEDPLSGLWVMTALALIRQDVCCDSGCRHCPYIGGGDAPGDQRPAARRVVPPASRPRLVMRPPRHRADQDGPSA